MIQFSTFTQTRILLQEKVTVTFLIISFLECVLVNFLNRAASFSFIFFHKV